MKTILAGDTSSAARAAISQLSPPPPVPSPHLNNFEGLSGTRSLLCHRVPVALADLSTLTGSCEE